MIKIIFDCIFSHPNLLRRLPEMVANWQNNDLHVNENKNEQIKLIFSFLAFLTFSQSIKKCGATKILSGNVNTLGKNS